MQRDLRSLARASHRNARINTKNAKDVAVTKNDVSDIKGILLKIILAQLAVIAAMAGAKYLG